MSSQYIETARISSAERESPVIPEALSQTTELSEAAFEPGSMVRVLITDNHHEIFARGLNEVLNEAGLTIVAEADDGQEAVRLARECMPDVAMLDIGMPRMNGLEAAKEIRKAVPSTRVILLTIHNDEQFVIETMHAGVHGYLINARTAAEVVLAVREVQRGEIYLSPEISRAVVDAHLGKQKAGSDHLTPREREVLRLVGEGKTTKEIAELLGVNMKTADAHRTNLMPKLNLHRSAELIHYAIHHGMVRPRPTSRRPPPALSGLFAALCSVVA